MKYFLFFSWSSSLWFRFFGFLFIIFLSSFLLELNCSFLFRFWFPSLNWFFFNRFTFFDSLARLNLLFVIFCELFSFPAHSIAFCNLTRSVLSHWWYLYSLFARLLLRGIIAPGCRHRHKPMRLRFGSIRFSWNSFYFFHWNNNLFKRAVNKLLKLELY